GGVNCKSQIPDFKTCHNRHRKASPTWIFLRGGDGRWIAQAAGAAGNAMIEASLQFPGAGF
ncbi:MAG: hypothetical protein ACRD1O_02110, partial [Terriglobia bacterium]